ncbi:hypothetical protein D9619_008295 [Psilocybe cf. subviscida]|uniref:Uncharacterized protein n=1 Tax=Psilocybe cf. subviscida TaxID=2480587 RepID=A0A8H5F153_9AGAR|nr:hypothetical protein D9619_008295 [Psilocybe cf. subviscida]
MALPVAQRHAVAHEVPKEHVGVAGVGHDVYTVRGEPAGAGEPAHGKLGDRAGFGVVCRNVVDKGGPGLLQAPDGRCPVHPAGGLGAGKVAYGLEYIHGTNFCTGGETLNSGPTTAVSTFSLGLNIKLAPALRYLEDAPVHRTENHPFIRRPFPSHRRIALHLSLRIPFYYIPSRIPNPVPPTPPNRNTRMDQRVAAPPPHPTCGISQMHASDFPASTESEPEQDPKFSTLHPAARAESQRQSDKRRGGEDVRMRAWLSVDNSMTGGR